MSAKSLAKLAVDRDQGTPGQSVKSATDVLVAAVPSEVLAAYTTLVGIMLAASIGSGYSVFRWTAYGVFIALAMLAPLVAYRRDVTELGLTQAETRRVPVPECLVAGLAAAAWALVMPGSPLGIIMRGNLFVFTTAGIALGAATLIGFATQLLGTANKKKPAAAAPAPPAGGPPRAAPAVVQAPDGHPGGRRRLPRLRQPSRPVKTPAPQP